MTEKSEWFVVNLIMLLVYNKNLQYLFSCILFASFSMNGKKKIPKRATSKIAKPKVAEISK